MEGLLGPDSPSLPQSNPRTVTSSRQDLKELPFVMLSLLIIPGRVSLSADLTDGIALCWLHITCTFLRFLLLAWLLDFGSLTHT